MDHNQAYFDYKVLRLFILSVVVLSIVLMVTISVNSYNKTPDPTTLKELEYIKQGYVEMSAPPCTPGWVKYGDKVVCHMGEK